MALADRVDELVRGLPRDWERARIELTLDEEEEADRAALLLASATPGRSGRSFTFHVAAGDQRSGTSPAQTRRVLARLDQAGIAGRLRLAEAERSPAGPPAPAVERPTLAASWDALLLRLPPDWSDLYAEVELDSSDHLDRGALLLAPVNPARAGGPASFRFRAASHQGYGVAAGMARRAFQRLDDEGLSGRVRVLRVLSDTSSPFSQGPVWRDDGHAV
ncbi:MAG TPA: hypothetical protein VD769_13980 [Gaiellaceae bacterium]|nr:hypothetical protein [Gaiellaceae bacterium]